MSEANELFYLDEDGTKQDAELHNAIINPVDFPIDEKIMGPIRDRNRAKYLAEQQGQDAAPNAGLRLKRARTPCLIKARMTYIEGGMSRIIQDTRQAPHKAENSSATDQAAQAEFDRLHPEDQAMVRQAMKNHPGVSLAKTLEMMKAFGGL